MDERRWIWEEVLEEAVASWEPESADGPDGVHRSMEWVVDCMMGCYNFVEPDGE